MNLILLCLSIIASFFYQDQESLIGSYYIQSEDNFSTIELKKDSTFIYKNHGISTWTWQTLEGTWVSSIDTLILKEKYLQFDPAKYLVGQHDNILKEKNDTFKIRFHKYKVIKNQLKGFDRNSLDGKMKFSKFEKND